MKAAPFAYHRPATLDEVFDLLRRYGGDARILAGGQSLIPTLNMRLATPAALIDINRLPGLDGIHESAAGLVIGALARQEDVGRSPLVARHAPLITEAIPHVAHLAVRTRGTFGGSLALADPAAELPACVVALGARIRVVGPGGSREIPAAEFFRGIYTTALASGEVLTEVVIPPSLPDWRSAFDELARRHGDYALVGLAAHGRVSDRRVEECRLVYLGVGLTPVRVGKAEAVLAGRRIDGGVLDMASTALDADLDPPADVHASAALRRHLARVLFRRVVSRLVEGS